jgi:endonuclease/exonuclease/phosphatase family metal-dependent hydrolase
MEFAFNSYNRLMWADLAIGKDTLRVINVHLASYDLRMYSIRRNLTKIRGGLQARSWHAKLIYQFVKQTRYPVILCGDFNETPISYPYRKMNSILTDTFAGSGQGFQWTFRFLGLPVRIDHIFLSPSLRARDYHITHSVPWSDHSPVSARIGIR